jgi:hypothetical protein
MNGADLIFTYHEDQRPITVGITMLGDDSIMYHGSTDEHFRAAKHNFGPSGRVEVDDNCHGGKNPESAFDNFKLTNKIVMSRNLDDDVPLWCEVATVDDIPPLRTNVYSEMINTEINHYTEIRNETIKTEF